ncbi:MULTISPECIES: hypothetical protein [Pseudonocardia]|uniref:Uncharacterized protein n=2 Tax=Pseudonocardia TaxID=1847 RepID=A0A1Y2N7R2_PSEAH|nr:MULTISPECIES: hypothetical protein [Pseudonocardia]OSY42948.1 hypothetical protein BG845_01190 [Pseudonocardia autotrophica]TDN77524.1 hypothetical protein C8E95_6772 [Pseudonocardia autotrophica]BBG01552.1 hypothetical protein Pdca_27610 [Pseudonocardia autotrophica]GEC29099.1 hypothetical protein PSA01_61280 [Pseudonocardia saturnea]
MTSPGANTLSFLLGGPGSTEKSRFDFDQSPALLTGEETQIIRELTGASATAWLSRIAGWANLDDITKLNEVDLEVMAFLVRKRENPMLEWQHFRRTIAFLTVELVDTPVKKPASK